MSHSPIPELERESIPSQPHPADVTDLPTRLATAHDRAGRLLADRYAEGAVGDGEFEQYLARLRVATEPLAVERIVAELERLPPREAASAPAPGRVLPPGEQRILAVMSETRRRGAWRLPRTLRVRAWMADVKLDFRHTVIPEGFTIDVQSVMANVTLIVPPDVATAFDVFAMIANANSDAPDPAAAVPGTPTITVTGSAFMAEVKVVIRDRSR